MKTKAFKPPRHVHLDWRGGQLRSIGATAVIRIAAEANVIRDKTVAIGLLPAGVTLGDALMCRVIGDNADGYVIAEIRPTRFAPGAPSDQAGAMARDEFWPGIIGYEEFGEKNYWWKQE